MTSTKTSTTAPVFEPDAQAAASRPAIPSWSQPGGHRASTITTEDGTEIYYKD